MMTLLLGHRSDLVDEVNCPHEVVEVKRPCQLSVLDVPTTEAGQSIGNFLVAQSTGRFDHASPLVRFRFDPPTPLAHALVCDYLAMPRITKRQAQEGAPRVGNSREGIAPVVG